MEILQAEIVGYSSPKEIFVNGWSGKSAALPAGSKCKFIDMNRKCRTGCWTRLWEAPACGKAEGTCAKLETAKGAGEEGIVLRCGAVLYGSW